MATKLKQLVGSVVAERYRVQEMVGRGTMGAVYRAEHIHMKKTVALKVLHPSHTRDPEVVERFQREAQAAANIVHPNICTATDFGRIDNNFYYLVMEFLEGKTLIEALKAKETFGPQRALRIGIQMLSALERAHELGVVHRDLKPENVILIERDNDRDFVKITDFGVAQVRLFKDAARLTQAGVVYGSPLYMSPQQAGGKEVDHRADLYSVGIMLYELLTGKLPFYAKSLMVVLNMHISDPPPPFAVANPDAEIPRELEYIVMKLLAKAPEDRYQSASAARTDLVRVRDELLERARPVEPEANTRSPNPGRRVATAFVALFGVVFILWGGVVVAKALTARQGVEELSTERPNKATTKKPTMEFAPDEVALRTEEQRREFERRPDVARALAVLEADPESALGEFGDLVRSDPNNAHAHFLLGRAHDAAGNWPTAAAEYIRAIELEPAYRHDSQLQDDVMRRFEHGGADEVALATTVLQEHLGIAATKRLAEVAEHHNVRKIRRRALSLLQESGQLESLPAWNQATIGLRHASVNCEENLEWVRKIAALGDPRAVGALRRFSALPKSGCGDNRDEDCYACLRYDLRIAIEALEAAPR